MTAEKVRVNRGADGRGFCQKGQCCRCRQPSAMAKRCRWQSKPRGRCSAPANTSAFSVEFREEAFRNGFEAGARGGNVEASARLDGAEGAGHQRTSPVAEL